MYIYQNRTQAARFVCEFSTCTTCKMLAKAAVVHNAKAIRKRITCLTQAGKRYTCTVILGH